MQTSTSRDAGSILCGGSCRWRAGTRRWANHRHPSSILRDAVLKYEIRVCRPRQLGWMISP